MKTLLHRSLVGLALLGCLGLGAPVLATPSAPTTVRQAQVPAQPATPAHLAWQRVGSPLSLEA